MQDQITNSITRVQNGYVVTKASGSKAKYSNLNDAMFCMYSYVDSKCYHSIVKF